MLAGAAEGSWYAYLECHIRRLLDGCVKEIWQCRDDSQTSDSRTPGLYARVCRLGKGLLSLVDRRMDRECGKSPVRISQRQARTCQSLLTWTLWTGTQLA
jgi:hypothetical protein